MNDQPPYSNPISNQPINTFPNTPPQTPPITKPTKTTPYKITIAVLSVIAVALGVTSLLLFLQHQKPADNTTPPTDDTPSTATEELAQYAEQITAVEQLVEDLKQETSKHLIMDMHNDFGGTYQVSLNFFKEFNESFVFYQTGEDIKAYLPITQTFGFGIFPNQSQTFYTEQIISEIISSNDFQTAIDNFFAQRGFHKTDGGQFFNPETNIACSGVVGHVACANLSWINPEQITLGQQLATAYGKDIRFDAPLIIKDSSYSPYQTVSVPISTPGAFQGGALGLFYRSSPESNWQYFTGTQAVLSCSDYNTDDLKRAFAGSVCYDETTQSNSTVQP